MTSEVGAWGCPVAPIGVRVTHRRRYTLPASGKSEVVDRLSTEDVEGFANGAPRGGRVEEREQEAFLWSTFADYKRVFERIVIDPPTAAVQWRMTGSSEALDVRLDLPGATICEFDADGRIKRFWLFYDDPLKG